MRGEGDAGRAGGPKGDLYVVLSIRPHDFFERDGHDLHCVVPISFPQAALGAEIEIPGIDGAVNIKIPEGTQSGKELRVRGRGVPYLNEKGRGDLIVKVVVQIPRKLNRAQRELVTKLAEIDDGGQQAHVAGADGEDEGSVQLETGVRGRVCGPPSAARFYFAASVRRPCAGGLGERRQCPRLAAGAENHRAALRIERAQAGVEMTRKFRG